MEVHMKGWLMKGPNNVNNTKRKSTLLSKLFQGKWKKYFFVLYAPPCSSRLESLFRFVSLEYYHDETLCNKKASIDVTDCTEIKSNLNVDGMKHVFSFVGSIGAQITTFNLSASQVSLTEVWISKMELVLDLKSSKTSSLLFTSTRLIVNSKLDNSTKTSNNKYRHTCYGGSYIHEEGIFRSFDKISQEEANQNYPTGFQIENIKDKTTEIDLTNRETSKHRHTSLQTNLQNKAQPDLIKMLETHADNKKENNFLLQSSRKMKNVISSKVKPKNTQSDPLNYHHRSNTPSNIASNNTVMSHILNNSFNQMSNQNFNKLLYYIKKNNYIEESKNVYINKACKHAYTQTSTTDGTPINSPIKHILTFNTPSQITNLRITNKIHQNKTKLDLKRKRHEQVPIKNNSLVSNTENNTKARCTNNLFVSTTAAITTPSRFDNTIPYITEGTIVDEVSYTAAEVHFGDKTILKETCLDEIYKQPISVSDQTFNFKKHLNKKDSQQIKCIKQEKQQYGKYKSCIQSNPKLNHDLQHQDSLDIVIPCKEKKNGQYENRCIFNVYQQPHYKRPLRVSPMTSSSSSTSTYPFNNTTKQARNFFISKTQPSLFPKQHNVSDNCTFTDSLLLYNQNHYQETKPKIKQNTYHD